MKKNKKWIFVTSSLVSFTLFLVSVNHTYDFELIKENVEALVRDTGGDIVIIDGVRWYPQYVDHYDTTGNSRIEGVSHFLDPENYGLSPVPKVGGLYSYYTECADLVYVTVTDNDRICYGRKLNLTPSFLQ